MWRTPLRYQSQGQQKSLWSCLQNALSGNRSDFFAALPNASDKELVNCIKAAQPGVDAELMTALTDTISRRLPSFSPASASSALFRLSGTDSGSAPTFDKAKALIADAHWDLSSREAARVLIAFHRAGFRDETFPEAMAIAKRYIDFENLPAEDLKIVLHALKNISKKYALTYEEFDKLSTSINNSIDGRTAFEELVHLFLPWLALRPRTTKGRMRHLAVMQNLCLHLKARKAYGLKDIEPLFAPRLRLLVSPEMELLHPIDSVAFQRILMGFESVQCGLPGFNVRDWTGVLRCMMDFCHDRFVIRDQHQKLPRWVEYCFINAGRQALNKLDASETCRPSPPEMVRFIEYYVRWMPDSEITKALGQRLKAFSLKLRREDLSVSNIRDFASVLQVCLSTDAYEAWIDAMNIDAVGICAPKTENVVNHRRALSPPYHSPASLRLGACQWASSLEEDAEVDATHQLASRSEELASASHEKAVEVERLVTRTAEELVKTTEEIRERVSEIETSLVEHAKEGMMKEKNKGLLLSSEVDQLRQDIEILRNRLREVEERNVIATGIKEARQALNSVLERHRLATQMEETHIPIRREFDFNAFLRQRDTGARRSHNDPAGLHSFQSQLPRFNSR